MLVLGREAIRVMLFHFNDGEVPEEGTVLELALQKQFLFAAYSARGVFRTKAALQLAGAGHGMQIAGCGSEHLSGGGRAVLSAATFVARRHQVPFLILQPLDLAARSFWIYNGFSECGCISIGTTGTADATVNTCEVSRGRRRGHAQTAT